MPTLPPAEVSTVATLNWSDAIPRHPPVESMTDRELLEEAVCLLRREALKGLPVIFPEPI